MKRRVLSLLVLVGAITQSIESGECKRTNCPRCGRVAPCSDIPYEEVEGYDPYKTYYPYCSIYQDSKVYNVDNDDGESYWPGKRDDDFVDALTR